MKNKITHPVSFTAKTLILAVALFLGTSAKAQLIIDIAGNGNSGFSGDSGLAINALMTTAYEICVDHIGNVYFADGGNNRIRKIDTLGIITTIAGNGSPSFGGDGGLATLASLYHPYGVAVDAIGNIYIADEGNERIRKIDTLGIITTVAGNGRTSSDSSSGEPATSAWLSNPCGVAVDASGNIYIANAGNGTIQKVNMSTDSIWVVAGNGISMSGGDGGLAINAGLSSPYDVAVDKVGNIYIPDLVNARIRKVDTFGIISTIVGTTTGFSGDSGLATSAEINHPWAVAVDDSGNVYVADRDNNRIRKVTASTGIINTIAGDGAGGYSGNGGMATLASIYAFGVWVDSYGSVYISAGDEIRKITYCANSSHSKLKFDTTSTILLLIVDTLVTKQIDTIVTAQTSIIVTTTDSIFITTNISTTKIIKDSVVFMVQCTNVDSVIYADTVSMSNTELDTVIHESSDTTACSITTHSQITIHHIDTDALVSIDTMVTVATDTLVGDITKVVAKTDTVFVSTYLSTVGTIRDSIVFSVNQCDSSINTVTYADTVEDVRANYDTITHQSSDTTTLVNTGLENIDLPLAIKVYPSPFHAELNVDVGDEIATIVLTDALGRMIMQTQGAGRVVLQPNVLSGVYFLRVTDKNKSSTTIKVIAE